MNPRWFLIAGIVFAASFVICLHLIDSLPKVYVATALIDAPRAVFPWNGYDDTQPAAPIEVMNSPNFLGPVIFDLGLKKKWARLGFISTEKSPTDTEALSSLRKMLTLELVPGTNILKVIVSDNDPREAADIANALVDRYQTMSDLMEEGWHECTDRFQNQVDRQEKIIEERQAALQKIGNPQSPEYLNAKLLLDREQVFLQSLHQNFQASMPTMPPAKLAAHIISHAQAPTEPSQPQKLLCYVLVTIASAFLAAIVASFVAVVFHPRAESGRTCCAMLV